MSRLWSTAHIWLREIKEIHTCSCAFILVELRRKRPDLIQENLRLRHAVAEDQPHPAMVRICTYRLQKLWDFEIVTDHCMEPEIIQSKPG